MTVLVTEPTSLSANPVYRVVYTNLLYFVVMFLVPLVVLLILLVFLCLSCSSSTEN